MANVITALFVFTSLLSGRSESVSEICRGTHCFPAQQDWGSKPCVGEQCARRAALRPSAPQQQAHQSSRQGQLYTGYQRDAQGTYHHHQQRPQSTPHHHAPYTIIQPEQPYRGAATPPLVVKVLTYFT